jgi:hypothetical protein
MRQAARRAGNRETVGYRTRDLSRHPHARYGQRNIYDVMEYSGCTMPCMCANGTGRPGPTPSQTAATNKRPLPRRKGVWRHRFPAVLIVATGGVSIWGHRLDYSTLSSVRQALKRCGAAMTSPSSRPRIIPVGSTSWSSRMVTARPTDQPVRCPPPGMVVTHGTATGRDSYFLRQIRAPGRGHRGNGPPTAVVRTYLNFWMPFAWPPALTPWPWCSRC